MSSVIVKKERTKRTSLANSKLNEANSQAGVYVTHICNYNEQW